MKIEKITLTRGQVALVDTQDFLGLKQFKWIAIPSQHGWRAYRRSLKGEFDKKRTVYMHQQILGFPDCEVDHINHDGLDNRRCNLRLASRHQNAAHSLWRRPHGFRGIYRKGNRWISRITARGRLCYLGCFLTAREAAHAYDRAAVSKFGEFSVLNFPSQQPNI